MFGINTFDITIPAPSNADLKSVMSPFKLSSCVCACFNAESFASFNPSLKSLTFSVDETVILLNACKPYVVNMVFLYAFRSSSDIPLSFPFSSSTTSLKSLALPCASYTETPNSSSAFLAVLVGVYKSIIALFNDVAASSPVMFCSANLSKLNVTLSIFCP